MAQCIGRAVRYLQFRDVWIYTFAVAETYEIDMLQSQFDCRLLRVGDKYVLKQEKDLSEQEKLVNLGTGYEEPSTEWNFL